MSPLPEIGVVNLAFSTQAYSVEFHINLNLVISLHYREINYYVHENTNVTRFAKTQNNSANQYFQHKAWYKMCVL